MHCVTGDRPRAWVDWLSWAEYCYNTSYHSALRATPCEVAYGWPPPPILPVDPASARTEAAGALLRSRDEMLAEVQQRLLQAQQLAKRYYDGHHREAEFAVGDWVWLRLLHRSTQSLDPRARRKLGPRYAGPFAILERIGKVAYVFSFRQVHGSMMSSMSGCSSHSAASHPRHHRHFHRSRTGVSFLSRRRH